MLTLLPNWGVISDGDRDHDTGSYVRKLAILLKLLWDIVTSYKKLYIHNCSFQQIHESWPQFEITLKWKVRTYSHKAKAKKIKE